MAQESISRHIYRMRVSFPYIINIISLFALTSIICFLIYVGKTVQSEGSDALFREVSYQASVVALLLIISYSVVFGVFSNYLLTQ